MFLRKVSEILKEKVPDFQRLVDYQRVEYIKNSIMEDVKNNRFINPPPNNLVLAKTKSELYIVDGLHRLLAFRKILNEYNIDIRVYCREIDVKDNDEAFNLFKIVNDTRPLPDMPQGIQLSRIKEILDYLQSKYKNIFSKALSGDKIHRPHIHFNKIQEKLAEYEGINNINFIEEMERLNEKIKLKGWNGAEEELFEIAEKKGGFYLGIIPKHEWIDMIFNGTNETERKYKKQRIPQRLRKEVWDRDIGKSMEGLCTLCEKKVISFTNFHCGHMKAEKNGGETNLSNLKAICSECNLSMRTKSFGEMKVMLL
jgi:hypothetical protein